MFGDNMYCMYIKQFIKGEVFFLYFMLDVVDVFWMIIYFCFNVFSFYFSVQMINEFFDVVFVVEMLFMQQFGNLFVFGWMEVMEVVIFQFLFQLFDFEMVSQWCVDVGIFFCCQYMFIFWCIFYFVQMSNMFCQFDDYAVKIIDYC